MSLKGLIAYCCSSFRFIADRNRASYEQSFECMCGGSVYLSFLWLEVTVEKIRIEKWTKCIQTHPKHTAGDKLGLLKLAWRQTEKACKEGSLLSVRTQKFREFQQVAFRSDDAKGVVHGKGLVYLLGTPVSNQAIQ